MCNIYNTINYSRFGKKENHVPSKLGHLFCSIKTFLTWLAPSQTLSHCSELSNFCIEILIKKFDEELRIY